LPVQQETGRCHACQLGINEGTNTRRDETSRERRNQRRVLPDTTCKSLPDRECKGKTVKGQTPDRYRAELFGPDGPGHCREDNDGHQEQDRKVQWETDDPGRDLRARQTDNRKADTKQQSAVDPSRLNSQTSGQTSTTTGSPDAE